MPTPKTRELGLSKTPMATGLPIAPCDREHLPTAAVIRSTSETHPRQEANTSLDDPRARLLEAEAARLRRSEELLRRAGMLANLGSWEVNLKTGEVYWSDETCRIHGVEPGYCPTLEEGIAFYAPEARPLIIAAVDAGMTVGKPWDLELQIVRTSGERRWVRAVGEVAFENDRPVRLSGAFQDISDRKNTELQLTEAAKVARLARKRLDTLADNAPAALFEHRERKDGRIDLPYFSARLPELLGVSRAEMEADGAAAAKHIVPEDMETLSEKIRISRDALSPLDCRYRLDHPQKGRRWMQLSSTPFKSTDGSVTWHGNVFDCSEQVEAEEAVLNALEDTRVAHQRLQTVVERIPGALFEFERQVDGKARFTYFTAKMADLLGIDTGDLGTEAPETFHTIPSEDRSKIASRYAKSQEDLSQVEYRHRVLHPHKGLRWLHVWANSFRREKGDTVWFGKMVDITDRLEMEQRAKDVAEEVRRAHDRLNSIADIAPVGLFEYRIRPDGESDLPYTSARFNELLGYSKTEIRDLGGEVFRRIQPEDRVKTGELAERSARLMTPMDFRFRYRRPDGDLIWLAGSSVPRRENDGTIVWTGAIHDITRDARRENALRRAHLLADMKRAEQEHLALHDGLTGLPNRRFYDRTLGERVKAARGASGPADCILIQFDLDGFKKINDTFGHPAGDAVLIRVAKILKQGVGSKDFAARTGGDEFSIIMAPSSSLADAEHLVSRLRALLCMRVGATGGGISASFGVARSEDIGSMGAAFAQIADEALYSSKRRGGGQLTIGKGLCL